MPQARSNQPALSPIFRLDTPEMLDIQAIESAAAKPQRGAWRYLASIFDTAAKQHCQQFSIEPDATLWRVRYRTIDGFDEHVVSDPSLLIWAIGALQTQLWDADYHRQANRAIRFTWRTGTQKLAISLSVVQTVNGDQLQFDIDPILPMPPLLDELGFQPKQLQELRARLKQQHGMVLITSSQINALDDILLAINQELISPDRKLLSLHDRHRYCLPRTTQIDLPSLDDQANSAAWKDALNTFHDTLLISTAVPDQFHEPIANNCDQGVLAIHAQRVTRASDSIDLLNAGIIRRAPLHRTVNTIINHYPVQSICSLCAEKAQLSTDEQQWLQQLRTPATENVIGWLADGNTEQFMTAPGCEACANTGTGAPLSVFDIVHRNELNHQFPVNSATARSGEQTPALQRQLMGLAKGGRITLSEVLRNLTELPQNTGD